MTPLSFIKIAEQVAAMSKDPSTKVGALILGPNLEIRATGWNGFPRGVEDSPERLNDRPTKLKFTAHSEANAITNAARSGVSTDGCSLLVTALHPCGDCAKIIIQAGIKKVYAPLPEIDGRWADSFEVAATMFREAGVSVEFYDAPEKSVIQDRPYLRPAVLSSPIP